MDLGWVYLIFPKLLHLFFVLPSFVWVCFAGLFLASWVSIWFKFSQLYVFLIHESSVLNSLPSTTLTPYSQLCYVVLLFCSLINTLDLASTSSPVQIQHFGGKLSQDCSSSAHSSLAEISLNPNQYSRSKNGDHRATRLELGLGHCLEHPALRYTRLSLPVLTATSALSLQLQLHLWGRHRPAGWDTHAGRAGGRESSVRGSRLCSHSLTSPQAQWNHAWCPGRMRCPLVLIALSSSLS